MPSTASDFRRIALSLPETEERKHMNHPDFRVAGKIFATLAYPNKQFGMVKLTPVQQEDFVAPHPAAFKPVNGAWGRKGCTSVILSKANKRTLREALLAAWRNHAPFEIVLESLSSKKENTTVAKPVPGDQVTLLKAERGLLKGLPREDQNAIKAIVGTPVRLRAYDDDGRAELEFQERDGTGHFIYVRPDLLRRVPSRRR
jgi:hypothetical protein